MNKLKQVISDYSQNILGWKTNKNIVVIESDDWGSIRMPSKSIYDLILKNGYKYLDNYNMYDSIESASDYYNLFDVLSKHKDINDQNPIFTNNYILANPDFKKIKDNDFKNYFYEIFTDTYNKYGYFDAFKACKLGIENRLIYPQLHAREHVNVKYWMSALQENHKETMFCFDKNFFGMDSNYLKGNMKHFLASMDYENFDDFDFILTTLIDASNIFNSIFKFKSKSFIAPCYIWDERLEKKLTDLGIETIQGNYLRIQPRYYGFPRKKKFRTLGFNKKSKLTSLIRNVTFEPSETPNIDNIDHALNQIKIAFSMSKPAIISSHRVNYISSIDDKQANSNLILLNYLLTRIKKHWPNVEFHTSSSLGSLIKNENEK